MKIRKILVVYKRSVLEKNFQGGSFLKQKHTPLIAAHIKKIFKAHDEHYASFQGVCGVLQKSGISFEVADRKDRINFRSFDLVITVGGDGTFMEVSHQVKDKVVLGINSAPDFSIGRYCCSDAAHFSGTFDSLLKGSLKMRLLQRLCLRLNKKIVLDCILNDFLISHINPAMMSRYFLEVGNRKEEQKSSGLWVSSPSGSTGAVKSAGGLVVKPDSKKMVYIPRELYQGFNSAYKLKGGILKAGQSLRITSMMKDGMIYGDGGLDSVAFPYAAAADIGFSKYPLATFQKVS